MPEVAATAYSCAPKLWVSIIFFNLHNNPTNSVLLSQPLHKQKTEVLTGLIKYLDSKSKVRKEKRCD